jgi:hypothetical protein
LNTDYIYFGIIPPSRISVFKHVPPRMPYWELETIREHWLAGRNVEFENKQYVDDLLEGREGPPEYVAACAEFRKRFEEAA